MDEWMVVWLVGWFDVLKIGSGTVLCLYKRGEDKYFREVCSSKKELNSTSVILRYYICEEHKRQNCPVLFNMTLFVGFRIRIRIQDLRKTIF